MASERQIEANRQNARKSTGPRSGAGKRRASGNSYHHGFAARSSLSAQRAKVVESLARKIAGDSSDALALELARTAARADLELADIRRFKVALIESKRAPDEDASPSRATRSAAESERSAEAVRQSLPDLIRLHRYEQRATRRREQSLRLLANRAQFTNPPPDKNKSAERTQNLPIAPAPCTEPVQTPETEGGV